MAMLDLFAALALLLWGSRQLHGGASLAISSLHLDLMAGLVQANDALCASGRFFLDLRVPAAQTRGSMPGVLTMIAADRPQEARGRP